MKTTIDIQDELLARAKQYARKSGCTLRAVVEEGLREILAGPKYQTQYRLPDLSTGNPGSSDPLESYSWQDLRDIIYGDVENR
ncbi:MAG: type II toxin-antitoxin system VapB family antitoxin [Gemmatimonadota bacterium]|nr:type II toxin-antitoxin system VapB family antitoxin [Gemmatimonadota bacterium]MDE3257891.1 type II toxin-antitoxin system VapB family antitoxin [Gemmatimonadota bacterium]